MTAQFHQINLSLQFDQVLEIVRQLGRAEKQKLLLFLLGRPQEEDETVLTHFASEQALAKDWLTQQEDEAWQNL